MVNSKCEQSANLSIRAAREFHVISESRIMRSGLEETRETRHTRTCPPRITNSTAASWRSREVLAFLKMVRLEVTTVEIPPRNSSRRVRRDR